MDTSLRLLLCSFLVLGGLPVVGTPASAEPVQVLVQVPKGTPHDLAIVLTLTKDLMSKPKVTVPTAWNGKGYLGAFERLTAPTMCADAPPGWVLFFPEDGTVSPDGKKCYPLNRMKMKDGVVQFPFLELKKG